MDQAASPMACGLTFEQAVHHIVLEDYIAAVEAAEARRDRLTAQIEAMLPDWTLSPVVAALQTMRGMALVNAATLVAELGDLSRFANQRRPEISVRASARTRARTTIRYLLARDGICKPRLTSAELDGVKPYFVSN